MRLNSMEGSSRAILNYLDQLQKFHHQQGTQFQRIPMLDKKPMNLFELKKEVAKRGGYHATTQNKQWAQVGRAIGLGGKTCTSLSHSVKSAYLRWVLPYEDFIAKFGSPSVTRPGSPNGDDKDIAARMKRAQRFRKPKPETPPPPPPAEITPPDSSPSAKKAILPDGYLPKPGLELCEICGGGENDEKMLLCDGCNRGYHLYCFDPPMAAIPNTDWFCPDCLRVSGNDYGFEEGEVRSLYHFQIVANTFKERHFREKLNRKADEKLIVTEDECEKEFWRLVESPYDDVEVEYGADLHSTQHGSGFPVPEKQPLNPYSTCGWNLNNIPVLHDSLFCNIRNDISGMMIPWLYVGMAFSTFCWHTEDHYTYSINYHHWGETKTWYGIPASNADKFEETMKKKVPELFDSNPDLLFHLTTMLSPGVLVENGVDVVAIDQRPGEFVITFPRSYHAGFNHGYNFAEAVNFALPNWLPFGLDCVDRYHEYRKQPVFSHEELIIATSKRDMDVRSAVWLKPEIERMRDRELSDRARLRAKYPGIKEVVEDRDIDVEEEDQCNICHKYCYVTGLRCECSPKRIVCVAHEDEICQCESPKRVLTLRFSDEQLSEFVEHVKEVASRPNEWKVKYDALFKQYDKPPLKELQRLASSADCIPFPMDEAIALKEFVVRANDWVEQANLILHKCKRPSAQRRSLADAAESDTTDRSGGKSTAHASVERTLVNIERLLAESENMAFDCPEIKLLRTLAQDVYEFRSKARLVLDDPKVTSTMIRETQEWAKTLDVHIDEIDELEDKLCELRWSAEMEFTLNRGGNFTLDLEELIKMMDEGRTYGVKIDHPIMARLKDMKHRGDKWRVAAASLLKQRHMTIEEMKDMLAQGEGGPVITEMWDKISIFVTKCEAWQLKAREVLGIEIDQETGERKELEIVKRQPVSTLWTLLFDIEHVPVKLAELSEIKEHAKKAQDWIARVRRLLRSGSSRSALELAEETAGGVVACTSSETDDSVFCICRTQIDEGLMIECETCHTWYHGICVGVSKKQAKRQEHYICSICDIWNPASPRAGKRPSVDQIKALLLEASEMRRYEFPEESKLETIIKAMDDWKVKVQKALEDPQMTPAQAKNLLRCSEGMPVATDEESDALREKLKLLLPQAAPSPPPEEISPKAADLPAEPELKEQKSSEVFCVCREPHREDDGAMIGCDACGEWFHFQCVGLTADDAESIEVYTCPACEKRGVPSSTRVKKSDSSENGSLKITLKLGKIAAAQQLISGAGVSPLSALLKKKRKKADDLNGSSIGSEVSSAKAVKTKRRRSAHLTDDRSGVSSSHPAAVLPPTNGGAHRDAVGLGTDMLPQNDDRQYQNQSSITPGHHKRKKESRMGDEMGKKMRLDSSDERVPGLPPVNWLPSVQSLISRDTSTASPGKFNLAEDALPPAPPMFPSGLDSVSALPGAPPMLPPLSDVNNGYNSMPGKHPHLPSLSAEHGHHAPSPYWYSGGGEQPFNPIIPRNHQQASPHRSHHHGSQSSHHPLSHTPSHHHSQSGSGHMLPNYAGSSYLQHSSPSPYGYAALPPAPPQGLPSHQHAPSSNHSTHPDEYGYGFTFGGEMNEYGEYNHNGLASHYDAARGHHSHPQHPSHGTPARPPPPSHPSSRGSAPHGSQQWNGSSR
ncbi:hypothetical protein DFS34DRAFT_356513 [Phlyctochytrium arcticum]|nr:hypothetical protein DFS34DRAFT_356513 [Phlyctochytrium arcticum]